MRKKGTNKSQQTATSRPKLTARQQKVFDFVVDIIKKYGFPPTLREIGEHMGIKSTNGVSDHLKALERKGYIKRDPLRARAITPILDQPNKKSHRESTREIGVVGKVAAGEPIPRIESSEESIILDKALVGESGDIFALKVTGDSMIDDGIREGDLLFVRKQPEAQNGDIVIAVLDDEVTVKRFYAENGQIRLQPANEKLSPIYLSPSEWKDISVLGVSVGLYRRY